ncbi:MAG: radical SAM family heme chaperone HemW [Elusimicrobia bacterium]|nr:radical SAM family heme chaperone HemW [Elusimicrobiota bacterium]MBD3412250.1 radical SAM family heme chaperone HemW [Elusimicrobiota bacterium]
MSLSAVYLHIPFCSSKCRYCDFNSYAGRNHEIARYMKALVREITERRPEEVFSIYIGGGTPSCVPAALYKDVFGALQFPGSGEITVEINPGSASAKWLCQMKKFGVTRLSMGLQSTHADLLTYLGRQHTYEDFLQTYATARAAGYDSINIDLLYGIPGMTMTQWKDTLKKVSFLKPDHCSIYELTIEKDTPLWHEHASVDENAAADQYRYALAFLEDHGYNRYEVSNFSVPGKECNHNCAYWRRMPYHGYGAGAVSFQGSTRWKNIDDPDEYIRRIDAGVSLSSEQEQLTVHDERIERVFLGLRLTQGIIINSDDVPWVREKLKKHDDEGLVLLDLPRVRLSSKGMLFSNRVFRDLW